MIRAPFWGWLLYKGTLNPQKGKRAPLGYQVKKGPSCITVARQGTTSQLTRGRGLQRLEDCQFRFRVWGLGFRVWGLGSNLNNRNPRTPGLKSGKNQQP